MLKKYFKYFLYNQILSRILYRYERHVMYRIRDVWGIVHLKSIKNKGRNVKLVGYSRFLDPDGLTIGDNVRIGYDCFFFCKGRIIIGSNTIISRSVIIYSSNHNYNGDAVPYDNQYIHKPVNIGKNVWIGMGVIICPGVTIGDNAIIGMGTVVAQNVNDGEIIVGSPQRCIRLRDLKFLKLLESEGKINSVLWP